MDIYLLPKKHGEHFLFSTDFQEAEEKMPRESRPPEKRNKFWLFLKSTYKVFTEKGRRSEAILKKAAKDSRVKIYYPSHLAEEEANEIFDQLIAAQIKKHKRWLIVNGALLPISVLFSIVPGPNLLLAYLSWRSLAHYQSKKGGEKAISDLKIDLIPRNQLSMLDKLLNKRFALNRRKKIRRIGEEMGIEKLDEIY
jgi:hypothetical protein